MYRDIIGWNNYITAEETLQQAGALAHSKIKFDLDNIRENIGDIEMNVFVRIQCESGRDVGREDYEHLFVYKHSNHFSYSSVKRQ